MIRNVSTVETLPEEQVSSVRFVRLDLAFSIKREIRWVDDYPLSVAADSRKMSNDLEIRFERVLDSILDDEYQSPVPLVPFVTFESRKTFPGISSKLLE